jgi:tRNA(adenine34) deaminase
MAIDEEMMRRCLELGRIALDKGDAPVGSVLVMNGQIIAQGIEAVKAQNDPTAHAEIEAIRLACDRLQTLDLPSCILYTNIEPCWMCSYAIRQTRIGRVVFGIRNEKVGGFSSKFQVLTDENLKLPLPRIQAGLLQEECELLFAEYQREMK